MAPPLLPNFPFLTGTGTLTSPPPLPPSSSLRDSNPPNLPIYQVPTTRGSPAHIRQRRKLIRYHQSNFTSQETSYSPATPSHDLPQPSKAHFLSNPFTFFSTPSHLSPSWLSFPHPSIIPKSITSLTGIPPSAHLYNIPCLSHRLAFSPVSQRWTPALVDFIRDVDGVGGSPLNKYDPCLRVERTERFEEMRLGYALATSRVGGRKTGRKCLACEVGCHGCSLQRKRHRGVRDGGRCEGCVRRGRRWCILVDGGDGEGCLELTIPEPSGEGVRVLYVRDPTAHKHKSEIEDLASSLLEGEYRSDFFGTIRNDSDRRNCVLPSLTKVYASERKKDAGRGRTLARTLYDLERGYTTAPTNDTHEPNWRDYTSLVSQRYYRSHGLLEREPGFNNLPFGSKPVVELLKEWYWDMILGIPNRRQWKLEALLRGWEMVHALGAYPRVEVRDSVMAGLWKIVDEEVRDAGRDVVLFWLMCLVVVVLEVLTDWPGCLAEFVWVVLGWWLRWDALSLSDQEGVDDMEVEEDGEEAPNDDGNQMEVRIDHVNLPLGKTSLQNELLRTEGGVDWLEDAGEL